jgi:antirestriction protein ArdC
MAQQRIAKRSDATWATPEDSWPRPMRFDNRAIFRAASQASRATDCLMAFHPPHGATDAEMVS